jgi:(p)ppGpp synthase/HD superfamily hydrolase
VFAGRRNPHGAPGSRYRAGVVGSEPGSSELAAASAVLDGAYRGVRAKAGKGVPHAHVVAAVLAAADCALAVQVAGLLHDIVEDTAWSVADVRERFGAEVAALVAAVTEDDAVSSYRRRKRLLREQIAQAGPAALDIALADKVASLRYALSSGSRVPARKSAHYQATVAIAGRTGHPVLRDEAAALLAEVAARDAAAASPV